MSAGRRDRGGALAVLRLITSLYFTGLDQQVERFSPGRLPGPRDLIDAVGHLPTTQSTFNAIISKTLNKRDHITLFGLGYLELRESCGSMAEEHFPVAIADAHTSVGERHVSTAIIHLLYWLFVRPNSNGAANEVANRAAYTRVMQLGEATLVRLAARYDELMETGLAYFTATHPTRELRQALDRSISEVSLLTCSLIARYVLYSTATESKRRQRLSTMGFDATGAIWKFGADQWVTTILAVIVLGAGMMVFLPGTLSLEASRILTISVTFANTSQSLLLMRIPRWVSAMSLPR